MGTQRLEVRDDPGDSPPVSEVWGRIVRHHDVDIAVSQPGLGVKRLDDRYRMTARGQRRREVRHVPVGAQYAFGRDMRWVGKNAGERDANRWLPLVNV